MKKQQNPWRKDVADVYGGIALAFVIFGPLVLLPQKYANSWWQFLIELVIALTIIMVIRESRKPKSRKHHQDVTLI